MFCQDLTNIVNDLTRIFEGNLFGKDGIGNYLRGENN